MEQSQPDSSLIDEMIEAVLEHASKVNPMNSDDSIQLQSPEAIALNGLLSDLEFKTRSYESMAERHHSNYMGTGLVPGFTRKQSLAAFGIYINKAQEMRDLVDKWKPNKK